MYFLKQTRVQIVSRIIYDYLRNLYALLLAHHEHAGIDKLELHNHNLVTLFMLF